ncbi:hypothetical protein O6H91_09G073100 [Diphasiastrum complanatum]|uniref:Uncharacterized protein n=1 Tax=Diphasiastrum complanatum TaxID=34168 RepID=A0ACC2CQM6_DIPCM|nr:hypothetical protein O6H91_09G073100 [Diphasiastrum complanatum]
MASVVTGLVCSSNSSHVLVTHNRHVYSKHNVQIFMAGRACDRHGVKFIWKLDGQSAAALQSSSHVKAYKKGHGGLQTIRCEGTQLVDKPRKSDVPLSLPKLDSTSVEALEPPSDVEAVPIDNRLIEEFRQRLPKIDPVVSSSGTSNLHPGPASQKSLSRKPQKLHIDILKKAFGNLVSVAKERVLGLIVDAIYRPIGTEPNTFFKDNFGPVSEIGSRVPVQIIKGALPPDFPEGIYIRNGPNPQFGGGYHMTSPLGESVLHWFEGDGMLHATYFEKDGKISYQNKYVETEEFKMEKKRNKPLFLPYMKGDPKAIRSNFLLNLLRFGKPTKGTCNTTVYHHAGKVFSIVEGTGLPHETDMSDNMRTLGSHDFNGAWDRDRGFTAHPKVDPDTNEMVVTGYSPFKPYLVMGVVASDGETMLHKMDVGLDRCTLSHDTAITPRYTIIFDYPLIADVERLLKGEQLLSFGHDSYARIGVMPRYGNVESIKWFNVEMSCTFHVVNSFEDGNDVILHGFRSKISFFPSPPNMNKKEWFGRAITPMSPRGTVLEDPWIDGALLMHLHEWRFNMVTGEMVERDISDNNNFMEFPTIHGSYLGKKYKYAYANVADLDASKEYGMPMFGKQIKMHLPNTSSDQISNETPKVRFESRDFGPNKFGSEPQFVARPGGMDEDDGWLITYVYDRSSDMSEVHIVSTQNFEASEPITIISLPQRVPFGFHGCFVPKPQLDVLINIC